MSQRRFCFLFIGVVILLNVCLLQWTGVISLGSWVPSAGAQQITYDGTETWEQIQHKQRLKSAQMRGEVLPLPSAGHAHSHVGQYQFFSAGDGWVGRGNTETGEITWERTPGDH